jgi:hypothetical protein
MDETKIDNPALEKLLEERQELKQGVADYRAKDKEAKKIIAGVEAPSPFRVGRFVISRDKVAPREVSFETAESVRLNIKLADD